MNQPFISIISPVYKAEKIVDELVNQIILNVELLTSNYEIILVEDCGPDDSWKRIEENCGGNNKIIGIKLSRNFGQHYAITAGIEVAKGDYLIIMDCDLQDNPKYFQELFLKVQEGNDIIYTVKKTRKHSLFKNFTADIYNKFFNYLVDNKSHKSNSNIGAYSLITRKVANAFIEFNDYHRHYLMVLRWLGFKNDVIYIEHDSRYEGKSSYTFGKLVTHAIQGIISQSDKLLRVFVGIGLIISLISFFSILLIVVMYCNSGFKSGWASTITIILFSTGFILTGIGILGIYLGKTFEQTKNRPKYIIDIELNRDK